MADLTDTKDRVIAPLPRVTIQAFCETSDVAGTIEAAASDRRMGKAHVKIQMGGAAAAVPTRVRPAPSACWSCAVQSAAWPPWQTRDWPTAAS